MPRTPRRPAAIAVALLLAVLISACSEDAPAKADAPTTTARPSTTTTTAAPASGGGEAATTAGAAAPVAGACIEPVTPSSAGGPQLPAIVPCDDRHGGEIISVSTLDDGPDAAYPAVNDLTDSAAAALTACQGTGEGDALFDQFVGDNRLESPATKSAELGAHEAWIVSSLEAALFVPGPAAWSKGERWAACAVVLRNSTEALASYTGSAKGLRRPGKLTEAFAWCRSEADQSGNYAVVGCDQPHSLEQVASFSVAADSEAYPGNDQIDVLAAELCPALASTATSERSDSAPAADYGLSWTFPVEQEWADGDRTGRCYMRSLNQPTTGSFAAGTAATA